MICLGHTFSKKGISLNSLSSNMSYYTILFITLIHYQREGWKRKLFKVEMVLSYIFGWE